MPVEDYLWARDVLRSAKRKYRDKVVILSSIWEGFHDFLVQFLLHVQSAKDEDVKDNTDNNEENAKEEGESGEGGVEETLRELQKKYGRKEKMREKERQKMREREGDVVFVVVDQEGVSDYKQLRDLGVYFVGLKARENETDALRLIALMEQADLYLTIGKTPNNMHNSLRHNDSFQ